MTEPYLDLTEARRNRERVARHETDGYYDQQANSVRQWEFGKPPPPNVRLEELPKLADSVKLRRD